MSYLSGKISQHNKFIYTMSVLKYCLIWQLFLGNCHWHPIVLAYYEYSFFFFSVSTSY